MMTTVIAMMTDVLLTYLCGSLICKCLNEVGRKRGKGGAGGGNDERENTSEPQEYSPELMTET